MIHTRIVLTVSLVAISILAQAQIADGKCKFLGNVIAGSVPSSFSTYWNQVTPENSGKWGSVEATRDVMNWGQLDLAYNFAQTNGYSFKQHTFVWGQQQPAWITELMNDSSKPIEERYEEVRGEVEEWIRLYCERYPNTDQIDVVNEPFHATPSYDLALGAGWNWVKWAFEKAREYCPNAQLILNDYNILNNNSSTDSYLALVNLLKADNLIDGVGIQCHRFEIENTPSNQLKSNLDKLATSGLPLYITEFDVGNLNNESTGNPATDDAQQLEIMQRVFPVFWDHPAVRGVTVWGYIEGQTWQSTAYLLTSNVTERPALTWLKNYVPPRSGGSFCLVTGIDEHAEHALNVYPNPSVNGRFVVESKRNNLSILIRDTHGRIITSKAVGTSEPTEVYVGGSPGIYILEVSDGKQTSFRKLILQ